MAILSSDPSFRKKLKRVLKADREDLWKELHEIASFLVLIGAIPAALSLWRFIYSGLIPMPDPEDRTISVFGDGAISAICFVLNLTDISEGVPAPSFARREGRFSVTGTLKERVMALDRCSRERITNDPWYGCEWVNDPKPDQMPAASLRRARILSAKSHEESHFCAELEAYSLLSGLIANQQALATLNPCYQADALVLAADIAARHEKPNEALYFLRMWHDLAINWDYDVGEALTLVPIVRYLCDGALSPKHGLSAEACHEIVESLIEDLRACLTIPEPKKEPTWKYSVSVSYGQFYLEPLKSDPNAVYFQVNGESEQGFSCFPNQVAFAVPGDADECFVQVEFADQVPSLRTAVQAVAVPLIVEGQDGLYLRTVEDSGKKRRLDVPAGKYDILALFWPRNRKKADTSCFESFRVVLTFLPAGTLAAGCIKSAEGIAPDKAFLHE